MPGERFRLIGIIVPFEELLRDKKSIVVGVMYPGTETPGGIPLVKVGDIKQGAIPARPTYCISAETNEEYKRSQLQGDELLITLVGTPGECVVVEPHMAGWNPARAIAVARLRDPSLRVFLKTILECSAGKHLIDAVLNTTVQKTLNLKDIKQLPIPLPDRATVTSISEFSRALTDRITLLRETNATLEAIAQAIFKSWFVDFDPVRAKQEGRAPQGMDEATAALFPDSFEESALGLVPRGWRVRAISEVAEVVKGKSYSSKDLTDSHHTALVTLKSFERGGGFRLDGFKPYTGGYKPAQVVEPGDLIVAYTDVTQAAELIGKPAIVVGVEDYSTLVASLDVGIIRPDEEQVSRQFLYGLFRTEVFQSHTFSLTSGTTVLHLAKDGVGSFQFACPPVDTVNAFSEVAESLAKRNQTNIDQMRTLATLRDTLLPRLISGQLRLPDAEDAIAEAAA